MTNDDTFTGRARRYARVGTAMAGLGARLGAERMGKSIPDFPAELRGNATDLQTVTNEQLQIFNTQRNLHNARKRVLAQRIEQANEQIKGYQAQVRRICGAVRHQEVLAGRLPACSSRV